MAKIYRIRGPTELHLDLRMLCFYTSFLDKVKQRPDLYKEQASLLTNNLTTLVIDHDCDCGLQTSSFNPESLQALLKIIYKSSGHSLRRLVLPVSFIKHGFAPHTDLFAPEND